MGCLVNNYMTFFFSCIAGRVARHCRSTAGILRKKANYGRNSLEARKQQNKTNTTKNPNKKSKTPAPPPGKIAKQGETRWDTTRPSQPLIGYVVILHAVHCLDVSHIYICTYILRRVSNVRLQSTSLELISALTSLNFWISWRQPWTPDSLTLVSEMRDQKSLHRACNRHMSMVGLFLLLVCQNQHHLLSLLSGFTPCHRGIKWVSSRLFSEPSGSIPCMASSAITRVNLPEFWWTTDTDVSVEAMGMQRTLCPW